MRLNGEWLPCEDGGIRPIVRGEILGGDGVWREFEFLIDTGADRTVFSWNVLALSNFQTLISGAGIGGIGGVTENVLVGTRVRFYRQDGVQVFFNSQFAACTDPKALDMSVLGRDILDMFTLIVDRPGDIVAIIGQDHTYTISQRR